MVAPMQSSRPNVDGIMLLEQSFARLPHEEMRRQLRSQQRNIERDLTWCLSLCSDIHPSASTPSNGSGESSPSPRKRPSSKRSGEADKKSREDVLKAIDSMISRVRGLKRKLEPISESTIRSLRAAEARTAHLTTLHSIEDVATPAFEEWSRIRLDRMLADYLLRRGYSGSALELARSRAIEDLVDMELFKEIKRIETSLLPEDGKTPRSCAFALAWCSENKAALRKIKSTLEFDLRLQEFIELARVRTEASLKEAVAHARKHLLPLYASPPPSAPPAPASTSIANMTGIDAAQAKKEANAEAEERAAHDNVVKQVSRAMGLLACGPGGWAYGDLYSPARWHRLATSFRDCALQIHALPPQPILHIALSAGLSSLKLPACYSHEGRGRGSVAGAASAPTQPPPHLGGLTQGDMVAASASGELVIGASTSVSAPLTSNAAESQGLGNSAPRPTMEEVFGTSSTAGSAPSRPSTDDRNPDCPVCDSSGLGQLAREVPWSHHANSTLVCRISGRVMNEDDPPMVLPNGMVYSSSALDELAMASGDGTVTCPRTGDTFAYASRRKVFIS